MRPFEEHRRIQKVVRSLRIIVMALCGGITLFLLVLWLKVMPAKEADPIEAAEAADPLLAYVALGALGLMFPVWLILRSVLMRKARDAYSRGGPDAFAEAYSRAIITLGAMLEGVAFLGCVAWMITSDSLALGVALVCLMGLVLLIPSEDRVNELLEDAP